jgi:hypothetical protein
MDTTHHLNIDFFGLFFLNYSLVLQCNIQSIEKSEVLSTTRAAVLCIGYTNSSRSQRREFVYSSVFQLRLSPSKAEKLNTSAKCLLQGIVNKFINFFAIFSKPFAPVFDFPLCLGTTLIEIAVYPTKH